MTRRNTELRVLEIASRVLDEVLFLESSVINTPSWDSLASIDLVFAIEEEFEIAFSADALPRLSSISDIVEEIEKFYAS